MTEFLYGDKVISLFFKHDFYLTNHVSHSLSFSTGDGFNIQIGLKIYAIGRTLGLK